MVLAGIVAALQVIGGTLAEHTFLFLGAGEVSFFLHAFADIININFLHDRF